MFSYLVFAIRKLNTLEILVVCTAIICIILEYCLNNWNRFLIFIILEWFFFRNLSNFLNFELNAFSGVYIHLMYGFRDSFPGFNCFVNNQVFSCEFRILPAKFLNAPLVVCLCETINDFYSLLSDHIFT